MAKQSESVLAAVTLKGRDALPSAAERSALVAKLVAAGFRGQDLAGIIRANRSRGQIADDMKAMLKGLPKKV